MKPERETNQIMAEVFAESPGDDFRERLLRAAVSESRARHRRVVATRAVLSVMAVIGLSALFWRAPRPAVVAERAVQPAYAVVNTRPLEANELVHTSRNVFETVSTSAATVAVVFTVDYAMRIERIDDLQLFASLRGRPGLLIRDLDGNTTLVYADTGQVAGRLGGE